MYHHPDSGRNPVSTSPPTAANSRNRVSAIIYVSSPRFRKKPGFYLPTNSRKFKKPGFCEYLNILTEI
jgi:hypothetical protein